MTTVGVSGACGRMGRLAASAIAGAEDLMLGGLYAPGHDGERVADIPVSSDPEILSGVEVVVELTRPEVVDDNLERWRQMGLNVVVGTSGFDNQRIASLRGRWETGPPNCLIVPNFSIGAVLMMRFAEEAARFFEAAEVIELHHDRKADAPSGTGVQTAERIGRVRPDQRRQVESQELVAGVRGGLVEGVPVHSVRLPGLVAHQEVLFGGKGQLLTIRHDITDLESFVPGILLGVRGVKTLKDGVTVGLESLLGL